MNKEEILYWANRYDVESPYDAETEKTLGDKFRQTKEVNKDDLRKVVEWKFLGLPWKNKRLHDVDNIDDAELLKKSNFVFAKAENDSERINGLKFYGIGAATISVILTFYNPQDYCVFDRWIWRALFGMEKEGEYIWTTGNYIKVLKKLRDEKEIHNLDVRTIEKAYFKKIVTQQKRKRCC